MAVPKYKTSRSRTRMRRSMNMRISIPVLVSCPGCGSRIQRHRLCSRCGSYRGKQFIDSDDLD